MMAGQIEDGLLDLNRSYFKFLDNFFSRFDVKDLKGLGDILDIVLRKEFELSSCRDSKDYRLGISGWLYWYYYLKGYKEYIDLGIVDSYNSYLNYLVAYYEDTKFDPDFESIIADRSKLVGRIAKRFDTTRSMMKGEKDIFPITLFNLQQDNERNRLYMTGSSNRFSCEYIDGYHRLFSARLFHVDEIPFVVRNSGKY